MFNFTLENIGTCVKITWNYFPCLVLHKVKVFIDYAQGLVQLLLLIFTSMISFLALFIFMKDGKAVNYNGSEIIGLINLKYGKRTASRDNYFTENAVFSRRSREKVNNGVKILTCSKWQGSEALTKASCKWRDAQRAMRNRQFIGYTLGHLERNVRGRLFDSQWEGGCQIFFGQIMGSVGKYFHVAWARENLYSCKHGKPQSTEAVIITR